MPRLSNRLFKEFRTLTGARFYGFLSATAAAPTKDQMPYRTLAVKSTGIIRPGDVVQAPGGDKLLVLEYSNDRDWSESYRAAYVSDELTWQRRSVTTDPVSRVKRDTGLMDMGVLYGYTERPEAVAFEGSNLTKYRLLTGADVHPGDIIDGKTVKRVYKVMGVKGLEIE